MAGTRRFRSGLAATCLLFGLVAASAGAAGEQPITSSQTGLPLTRPVSQSLQRLQEEWLQWVSSFSQGNQERADAALSALLGAAQQIGMKRLPDLSLAAAVRAVDLARHGNVPRAQGALEAAEKLDPGRPENAFAAATVARLDHSWFRAVSEYVRAYIRLLGSTSVRLLWLEQLLLWACCTALLAAGLFVAVQMAAKGSALGADLLRWLGRLLPRPAAYVMMGLILLWPLALPGGLLWLALFWSILLWGYGSVSERVVLAVLWLIAGSVPILLAEQQRRVAMELSPPVSAISHVLDRRLSGSLFNEIGVLRAALPHSNAVLQFVGDLHRILGQWDFARGIYNQLIEAEPKNQAALIDLGAYYFRKNEFAKAVEWFKRAAEANPQDATAYFNLSVAYSESYQFDESRRALSQAQNLDERRVGNWIQSAPPDRVVTVDGGLERAPEIRAEFEAARRERAVRPPWHPYTPLMVAGMAALAALALHLFRRRHRYSDPELDLTLKDSTAACVARALTPGLASSEEGNGGRAFFALLVPVGLITLPFADTLGWRIPWGYGPSFATTWFLAILGLLLFFGLRLRSELAGAGDASGA